LPLLKVWFRDTNRYLRLIFVGEFGAVGDGEGVTVGPRATLVAGPHPTHRHGIFKLHI